MSETVETDAQLLDEVLGECDIPIPQENTIGYFENAEQPGFLPYVDQSLGPGGLENLQRTCDGADACDPPACDVESFDMDLHNFIFGDTFDDSLDVRALLDEANLPQLDVGESWPSGSCPQPLAQPVPGPPEGSNQAQTEATTDPSTSAGQESGSKPGGMKRKGSSKAESAATEDSEAEKKRKARQQRNRENAHNSRQRKKMYLDQLETKCRNLESENYRLKMENATMRHQLASFLQAAPQFSPQQVQVGQNAWGSSPVGSLPHYAPTFTGCVGVGNPKLPLWPVPEQSQGNSGGPSSIHVGNAEAGLSSGASQNNEGAERMVFIAKKQARKPRAKGTSKKGKNKQLLPETADSTSSHNSGGTLDVSSGSVDVMTPQSKKPRVVALAASLAVICMVAALCGPGLMLRGNQPSSSPQLTGGSARHLQSLLGLPDRASVGGDRSLVSIEGSPDDEVQHKGDGGSDWATRNFSLQFPGHESSEELALAKLKELGPMAVLLSDADLQPLNQRGPLKNQGWSNFTELMSEAFSSSGFHAPSTCQEVFRFDASLVSNVEEARKKLQRQVMAMSLYRGFPVGPLPLPPAGDREEVDQGGAGKSNWSGKGVGSGDDNDTGVIVSVFVPVQDSVEKLGMLTAVQSIFIVVLKPLATYLTFSCPLNVPVFA
ncbi:hypothetical protein BSKO_01424 [Bryopsis sp. KO-2023]|nr:hypothetical protein BSKO_01424 [Bryopsis sp. KO-2023]